jgi:outer membrane lipopolysaccharide assembly protein LptE/RlpB
MSFVGNTGRGYAQKSFWRVAYVNRRKWTVLTGLLLSIGLSACGYGLQGRNTSLSPEIQTITIPTMVNQTLEAGIENVFTRAVIREFNLDRRLKVVREKHADSILTGSIQDFSISSISYDTAGLALEYRAQVTVGLILRRVDTSEVLWEAPALREHDEYRASSDVLTNEGRKEEAIEEIARQLAETIHDLIVERF